jgi:hypothetical protein
MLARTLSRKLLLDASETLKEEIARDPDSQSSRDGIIMLNFSVQHWRLLFQEASGRIRCERRAYPDLSKFLEIGALHFHHRRGRRG